MCGTWNVSSMFTLLRTRHRGIVVDRDPIRHHVFVRCGRAAAAAAAAAGRRDACGVCAGECGVYQPYCRVHDRGAGVPRGVRRDCAPAVAAARRWGAALAAAGQSAEHKALGDLPYPRRQTCGECGGRDGDTRDQCRNARRNRPPAGYPSREQAGCGGRGARKVRPRYPACRGRAACGAHW